MGSSGKAGTTPASFLQHGQRIGGAGPSRSKNPPTSSAGNSTYPGPATGPAHTGHRLYRLCGYSEDFVGGPDTDFYASIIPTWSKEFWTNTRSKNNGRLPSPAT